MFVQGTDPECALQLEATAEKTWRNALARQTRGRLVAELDGKQLFDLSAIGQASPSANSAFTTITPQEAR